MFPRRIAHALRIFLLGFSNYALLAVLESLHTECFRISVEQKEMEQYGPASV